MIVPLARWVTTMISPKAIAVVKKDGDIGVWRAAVDAAEDRGRTSWRAMP